MILSDYHVHSNFSSDGQASMEQMIEQAIKLGFKRLCFTDHMDYEFPVKGGLTFVLDPEQYWNKLIEVRERYHSQIEILSGLELGLQPHLSEKLTSLINQYPFDFIIGSSHLVNRMDPYDKDFWTNKTSEEGIRAYFKSIIDNCKAFQGFHVYGHLDYVFRYIPGQSKTNPISYTYQNYADLIDEALKAILSLGKGIEVNTSGYKYGRNSPHPQKDVLKRYKELGGELITIGSDSHKPEHLGFNFATAKELLASLGFRYYAVFVQGKPIYEKL